MALLPAFNPDHDFEPLPTEVVRLRSAIAASDAVVFCTPEYAGTLPGSFKNLLDWTVGGPEMYRRPVAWINIAHPGRGEGANQTIRIVLGYVGADIIEEACAHVPVGRDMLNEHGLIVDPQVSGALAEVLVAVATYLDGLHGLGQGNPRLLP